MSLNLTKDSIDSEHVVKHIVKENELNIKLFFMKDLESRFDVITELLALHRNVVFRGPVREQDWPMEGLCFANCGEMLLCNSINVFIGPRFLVFRDQPILEEPKSLVCPYSDKILN